MRPCRFLPYLVTCLSLGLLALGLRSPKSKAGPSLPDPPAELMRLRDAAPDPSAARAVEETLSHLAAPGREWLQAAVWLRCHVPGLTYQGEGAYLKAPGGRYRLEARTRRGRSVPAAILAVSDGRERWQAIRAGVGGYREVRRLRLGMSAPPGQLLAGIDPLLHSLHAYLLWVRHDGKRDDLVVTGIWRPELRQRLAPAERPWPANLPRACRLTLRGSWPRRIEWWGPAAEGGADRLLLEIEFRDPVWGQPLPEEQCARLFAFEPGDATVVDLTPPGPASP